MVKTYKINIPFNRLYKSVCLLPDGTPKLNYNVV